MWLVVTATNTPTCCLTRKLVPSGWIFYRWLYSEFVVTVGLMLHVAFHDSDILLQLKRALYYIFHLAFCLLARAWLPIDIFCVVYSRFHGMVIIKLPCDLDIVSLIKRALHTKQSASLSLTFSLSLFLSLHQYQEISSKINHWQCLSYGSPMVTNYEVCIVYSFTSLFGFRFFRIRFGSINQVNTTRVITPAYYI